MPLLLFVSTSAFSLSALLFGDSERKWDNELAKGKVNDDNDVNTEDGHEADEAYDKIDEEDDSYDEDDDDEDDDDNPCLLYTSDAADE